ncbi:hypothetical protein ABZ383_13400 [Streptomyces sp. NPDC005900]
MAKHRTSIQPSRYDSTWYAVCTCGFRAYAGRHRLAAAHKADLHAKTHRR